MELSPSGRPVAEILDDAVAGRRISAGDAHTLLLEGDLLELGLAADEVRNRLNDPGVATYNIDRNINYTNVCVYECRFCAFYREPGDAEGYLLPLEEIGRKIEETLALGGTGILMQGGVHPDLPLSYYEELLGYMRERYPEIHLHAFSPPEIKFIASKERLSFYEVIGALKEAGLMSIPGGGAEILSDAVRKEVLAWAKTSADEWIDIMRQAHRHGLRTSATMMYGMGEGLEPRVEHFQRIRDLQDETGGFTAFISWTFQHDHTDMAGRAGDLAHEYLTTLAVSRLFLDNVQPSADQLGDPGQEDRPAGARVRRRRHGLDHDRGERRLGRRHRLQDEPGGDGAPDRLRRLHAAPAHQPLRALCLPRGHRRGGAPLSRRPDRREPRSGVAAAGHRLSPARRRRGSW